jgi:hypothetical protein
LVYENPQTQVKLYRSLGPDPWPPLKFCIL